MKVKKEVTVAVVIGLILALLVTGGILRARSAISKIKLPQKDNQGVQQKDGSSNTKSSNQLSLEITSGDNIVSSEAVMTLSGKTLPGTYIAILGEKGEYLIVPNDLGNFAQEIALVKGANTIKITVYQNDGTKIEKTVNAVYTSAQL